MPADLMESDLRVKCNIYMETPLNDQKVIDHQIGCRRTESVGFADMRPGRADNLVNMQRFPNSKIDCYQDFNAANNYNTSEYNKQMFFGKMSKSKAFYLIVVLLVLGIGLLLFIAIAATISYASHKSKNSSIQSNFIEEDACLFYTCPLSKHCVLNESGKADCVCKQCDNDMLQLLEPVCGTDNRTYKSKCDLQYTSCLASTLVFVNHTGTCSLHNDTQPIIEQDTCPLSCGYGEICVRHTNHSTNVTFACECEQCADINEFNPVCGSDHTTYKNPCLLRYSACERKQFVAVLHHGECESCENIVCPNYSECEINAVTGMAECICPKVCVRVDDPVCATNGNTYENECELRMASCRLQTKIEVAYNGRCDLCRSINCKFGSYCSQGHCLCVNDCVGHIYEPICGNDGNTYMNECEMNKWSCLNEKQLMPFYYGECREMNSLSKDFDTSTASLSSDSLPETTKAAVEVIASTVNPITTIATNNEKSFKSVTSVTDASCESLSCQFGGQCLYDENGKPYCHCYFDCRTRTDLTQNRKFIFVSTFYENICGSDGNVYDNECHLKTKSCQLQKHIYIEEKSFCESKENGDQIDKNIVEGKKQTGCENSKYGCCRDKVTPAPGPLFLGCPERCGCNKRGSYGSSCDPVTRQCRCKPGIGGIKCNRCEPGFWGLHKILEGNEGCFACNCNKFGSVRNDCEQTTGKCVCKPGITGLKCDKCPQGTLLGPEGCTHASIAYPINGSCDDVVCLYGAICVEKGTKAQCVCDITCTNEFSQQMLCGSDGTIFMNECQLKLASCRYQKQLSIAHSGPC